MSFVVVLGGEVPKITCMFEGKYGNVTEIV